MHEHAENDNTLKMVLAVESSLALNISSLIPDLPHGGTVVAGRRRRINNDPYGGEGYVWEDIPLSPDPDPSLIIEYAPTTAERGLEPDCLATAEVLSQQRSIATERLAQLKQHLIDASRRERARPVGGLSLDNIHLNLGGLHDWQTPRWDYSKPIYQPPSRPGFDRDWQTYARRVLFAPPVAEQNLLQYPGDRRRAASVDIDELFYHIARDDSSYPRRKVAVVSYEQADVHCNSWSSLLAHRRREIAAVA